MTGAVQADLFAAQQARDEGIERADATVARDATAEHLVAQTTQTLIERLRGAGADRFSADNVGAILDAAGVSRKDLALRRRLVSGVINRGAGRLWRRTGNYVPSTRRHCAPIAEWQLLAHGEG